MLGKEVVWVVEILVSIPISDRENSNLQPSFIAELICFNILRRGELGRYALHWHPSNPKRPWAREGGGVLPEKLGGGVWQAS